MVLVISSALSCNFYCLCVLVEHCCSIMYVFIFEYIVDLIAEQLRVNYDDRGSTDWRADWKKSLPECVDSFEPCFILFRLDSPSSWLLIRLISSF